LWAVGPETSLTLLAIKTRERFSNRKADSCSEKDDPRFEKTRRPGHARQRRHAGRRRLRRGGLLPGPGCAIRQDVRIGRGSLIGMGAVVVKDVVPDSVIIGNPGRKLRDRIT